jgi:hypothetical protein
MNEPPSDLARVLAVWGKWLANELMRPLVDAIAEDVV